MLFILNRRFITNCNLLQRITQDLLRRDPRVLVVSIVARGDLNRPFFVNIIGIIATRVIFRICQHWQQSPVLIYLTRGRERPRL